jgi:DnaA family protein
MWVSPVLEKKQAVLDRVEAMGVRLNNELMQFILNLCSRDLRQLMDVLNTIDKASMAEKRHLTIPFVKRVFVLVDQAFRGDDIV